MTDAKADASTASDAQTMSAVSASSIGKGTDDHGHDHDQDHDHEQEVKREIEQAVDEGHDADIPSSMGYVLDERGEQRRRHSLAEKRRNSLARRPSNASGDVEKAGQAAGVSADDDEDAASDDANVVDWDGPDDPQNPFNWPTWYKTALCAVISSLTFVTPLASSIFAPGVPQLMKEFGNSSQELSAFVVSVYILGFAFGPLLIAPLSEIYGRNIVYHVCNVGFIGMVVGCALSPTLDSLIAFRFLSGIFGSCPVTNGGGSIADMVVQEKRGLAMSIFTIGPMLGPIIGPVAGGFLSSSAGWRWVFWLLAIIAGVLGILSFLVMRETYAPVLLERKAARLRLETGNPLLRSRLDIGLSPRDYFARGIGRPIKMLLFSPVVQICSLYVAIVYGYLYLMFTSITEVFELHYGFTTNTVGLVYLGLGIGSFIGMGYFSVVSDRYIREQSAKNGGEMKPEYRLRPLFAGAVVLPIGFFIYGWTAEYHKHWIAPILGMVVIGTGNLIVFMALQLYLVDAFTIYAASALASNTVSRSVVGAVLPLCGLRMYSVLGLGWGNSLLGFIALALVPVPILFTRYGEYLRHRFVVKNL